jgi:hypothetical protein
MAHEPDVVDRMRVVSRQLNSLACARGGGVGRMSFDDIIEVAQSNGLFAWLLSDDVTDERDGAYWRVFRLSPVAEGEDEGHGAVVVETAWRPRLLPVFNLYRHDDDARSEGVAELRARYPGIAAD